MEAGDPMDGSLFSLRRECTFRPSGKLLMCMNVADLMSFGGTGKVGRRARATLS
jgi:hypothetical protein